MYIPHFKLALRASPFHWHFIFFFRFAPLQVVLTNAYPCGSVSSLFFIFWLAFVNIDGNCGKYVLLLLGKSYLSTHKGLPYILVGTPKHKFLLFYKVDNYLLLIFHRRPNRWKNKMYFFLLFYEINFRRLVHNTMLEPNNYRNIWSF